MVNHNGKRGLPSNCTRAFDPSVAVDCLCTQYCTTTVSTKAHAHKTLQLNMTAGTTVSSLLLWGLLLTTWHSQDTIKSRLRSLQPATSSLIHHHTHTVLRLHDHQNSCSCTQHLPASGGCCDDANKGSNHPGSAIGQHIHSSTWGTHAGCAVLVIGPHTGAWGVDSGTLLVCDCCGAWCLDCHAVRTLAHCSSWCPDLSVGALGGGLSPHCCAWGIDGRGGGLRAATK